MFKFFWSQYNHDSVIIKFQNDLRNTHNTSVNVWIRVFHPLTISLNENIGILKKKKKNKKHNFLYRWCKLLKFQLKYFLHRGKSYSRKTRNSFRTLFFKLRKSIKILYTSRLFRSLNFYSRYCSWRKYWIPQNQSALLSPSFDSQLPKILLNHVPPDFFHKSYATSTSIKPTA